MSKPGGILIIRLSAMGDVAMTSPVVDALCRQNPDCRVTFLSTSFFKPFFANHTNFTFFGTDIKKTGKGISSIYRLYKELKQAGNYDVVVDAHNVLRTKVLRFFFFLSGSKVLVIDKGRAEKHALTRRSNKKMVQLKSTIDRYADLFRRTGLNIDLQASYPLPKVELNDKITALSGVKSERWIGIAPFAQHKGKMYPVEKVEEVVKILHAKGGIRMFIFGGGAAERAVAEDFQQRYSSCTSVIGRLSLDEELALISNLDSMMSMDSSAMHMASLSGVRVVSVWGATHPFAGFLGYRQSMSDVVQRDIDCRPCSVYGNKPCYKGTWECLDIEPSVIAAKLTDNL